MDIKELYNEPDTEMIIRNEGWHGQDTYTERKQEVYHRKFVKEQRVDD